MALPLAAEPLWAGVLPEDVAEAADVAVPDDGTPIAALAIAPAKAFSSSVRAADTGSVAECFDPGSLGSSVLAVVLPLAPAVLVGAASAAGPAASD
jgi:hypothetical protein